MAYWIKADDRPKCTKFICSKCNKECHCICYTSKTQNICNYKFCPHCGEPMQKEVEKQC